MATTANGWDFTVGWAGAPPFTSGATPTWPVLEVTDARWSGDTLELGGVIAREPTDTTWAVANWKSVRRQLLGLLEPEERWVPVKWAQDSWHDGYYRVENVELESNRVVLAEGTGRFTATLRRFGASFQRPVVQLRQRMVLMPNDHGLVAATHIAGGAVGLAQSAEEVSTAATMVSTAIDDPNAGSVWAGQALWASSAETTKLVDTFASIPPAAWYDGACWARVPHGQAGWWWPIHGRQTDASSTATQIGNGLVRASAVATGSGGIQLDWTVDNLPTYTSAVVEAYVSGTAITGRLRNVAVVRNTPELAVLRTSWQASGAPSSSVPSYLVDVAVHRGSRMVRFAVQDLAGGATRAWGMRLQSAAACTALSLGGITAGAQATVSATNRKVLCCPKAHTQVTASGGMTQTSATAVGLFGFGCRPGSGSASPFTDVELAGDYYSPIASRTMLVAR